MGGPHRQGWESKGPCPACRGSFYPEKVCKAGSPGPGGRPRGWARRAVLGYYESRPGRVRRNCPDVDLTGGSKVGSSAYGPVLTRLGSRHTTCAIYPPCHSDQRTLVWTGPNSELEPLRSLRQKHQQKVPVTGLTVPCLSENGTTRLFTAAKAKREPQKGMWEVANLGT